MSKIVAMMNDVVSCASLKNHLISSPSEKKVKKKNWAEKPKAKEEEEDVENKTDDIDGNIERLKDDKVRNEANTKSVFSFRWFFSFLLSSLPAF